MEYRDVDREWRRVVLGSGFLVSPDGLFVTAYHVMKYCLGGQRDTGGLSVTVDCSTAQPNVRYIAVNDGREFPIEIVSHLKEMESIGGKNNRTPDEIIKQRDFVIAKLKTDLAEFSYWRVRDFDHRAINVGNPRANFRLTPMLPPTRVFIAGFPQAGQLVLSEGFLNLTEKNKQGYFAVDMNIYTEHYLESQDVPLDTVWGIRVENHMSGGAVVDPAGYLVGLLVNGNESTAAVLSIENILVTFFTRENRAGADPAVILEPTLTPLFLKQEAAEKPPSEDPAPNFESPKPEITNGGTLV